jgi:hypothetical protein
MQEPLLDHRSLSNLCCQLRIEEFTLKPIGGRPKRHAATRDQIAKAIEVLSVADGSRIDRLLSVKRRYMPSHLEGKDLYCAAARMCTEQ